MNFLFDEDQELLRRSTRGLIARLGQGIGARGLSGSEAGMDRGWWRRGAELGWFSMLVPQHLGGGSLTGQGLIDTVAMAEEWGRSLHPGPLVSTNVVCAALAEHGSPAQQGLLAAIVDGRQIATWCVAEVGADWDPALAEVEATRTSEGFALSGTKLFVENADVADHLLVTARADGGIGEFLVPAGSPGVTIEAQRTLDLTRRLSSVTFRETLLPDGARLPGADLAAVERQLDRAAVMTCADGVGGAERVLEMTVDYTRDRVQFGRPIASFQAVKHRCADLLIQVEGARAASRYAALSMQEDRRDAAMDVDIAKAHVGETCSLVAGEGIQLHGGIGFTWEHDMHLYARRAKTNEVLFGSPAWRRRRVRARLDRLAADLPQRTDGPGQ